MIVTNCNQMNTFSYILVSNIIVCVRVEVARKRGLKLIDPQDMVSGTYRLAMSWSRMGV